jgi:hypothetical protein
MQRCAHFPTSWGFFSLCLRPVMEVWMCRW